MATTARQKIHDKTLTKFSGVKMEMDMTRMSKCHGHFQNAIADACISLICLSLEPEWPDLDQIDHAMTLILTHFDDVAVVNVSSLCGGQQLCVSAKRTLLYPISLLSTEHGDSES